MKVVITGGAGFVGSNFVRELADGNLSLKPSSISVIDKITYAGKKENIQDLISAGKVDFFQTDICDYESVSQIIDSADYLINFAAESHVDRSIASASEFVRTNILGTQILLDVVLASERPIRYVQISTDEVYGSISEGSWDEECPLKPNSPYAASKAAADLLVLSYVKTHGIDAVITRCSNNYGPYQFPEKAIPLFISQLLAAKKIPLYGDGLNKREWIHVLDHCRGIDLVALNGEPGQVYNIGSGIEMTNLDLAQRIINFMHLTNESIEFVEDRKGHDQRYSVSWEKIESRLGYRPHMDFDEGLNETIAWYLNQAD